MFDHDEKNGFGQEPDSSPMESPAPEGARVSQEPRLGESSPTGYEYGEESAPAPRADEPASQTGLPTGAAPEAERRSAESVPPYYTYTPPMGQPPYGAPPPWEQPPSSGGGVPPKQTQWVFNDYGPIGGPPKPKKPPKTREGKPAGGAGTGVKVLAIVMSALFVLSVAGFGGYILYNNRRIQTEPGDSASSQPFHIQEGPAISDGGGAGESSYVSPITGEKLSPTELYEAVEPAVVGVVGYVRSGATGVYQPASQGSGVVFDSNGYIVTNRHVIKNETTDQNYDRVEVIRSTGETYTAEVLGSDRETDLAVLKVDDTDLRVAVFGNSDKVKVGDQAFVIGNPNGIVYAGSLAGGYISAVNRKVYMESSGTEVELLQTDAAINPGNSGGALVDVYGQVIGITSAKLVGTSYEGMGFAIPINNVKPIVESLIDNGYVAGRVQIGISYQVISKTVADLNGIPQGLRVAAIEEYSDAAAKGLQIGDIIYAMDGMEVKDTPDVKKVLEGKNPGETLTLSVYRVDLVDDRAQRLEVAVTLLEKVSKES